MIQIGNAKITYDYMGYFTTNDTWLHPNVCEKTYELIYVTEGTVSLWERDTVYELAEGDLVILAPGIPHGGYSESHGRTSFYWLHFYLEATKTVYSSHLVKRFMGLSMLRELLHHAHDPHAPLYLKEACLCHLLAAVAQADNTVTRPTLAANVYEWTRINARCGLTVSHIASHFGYNGEYLSRLVRKEYGITLKALIDRFLIAKAKNHLANSRYSVKEIATLLGFSEPNTFIHFFKYHEGISPTLYRNTYHNTHMNKQ